MTGSAPLVRVRHALIAADSGSWTYSFSSALGSAYVRSALATVRVVQRFRCRSADGPRLIAAQRQRSVEHLGGPHHALLIACSTREKALQADATAIFEREIDGAFRGQDPEPGELHAALTKPILETYSDSKASTLFARFRRNETWQVPTLVALRSLWSRQGLSADDLTYGEKVQQKQLDVVVAMWRSGVKVMAGTDGPLAQAGPALHDELALFVKAGLSPMQALQAATRNPAEFMGRLRDFGTVERGKIGDVILLDANPLVDITNTRRVTAVILGGRLATPVHRPSRGN